MDELSHWWFYCALDQHCGWQFQFVCNFKFYLQIGTTLRAGTRLAGGMVRASALSPEVGGSNPSRVIPNMFWYVLVPCLMWTLSMKGWSMAKQCWEGNDKPLSVTLTRNGFGSTTTLQRVRYIRSDLCAGNNIKQSLRRWNWDIQTTPNWWRENRSISKKVSQTRWLNLTRTIADSWTWIEYDSKTHNGEFQVHEWRLENEGSALLSHLMIKPACETPGWQFTVWSVFKP